MAEPLVALALGFGLGLSLAAPPGPVNALIAREASRHGALAGFRAGIPAPIVDTAYMLIVLFGIPQIIDLKAFLPWMSSLGAVLMGYLAVDTVRHRLSGPTDLAGAWKVWAVTLTNPFQYAWWLSAGAVFLGAQGLWGIVGFLAAIFGWVLTFSNLVAHGASRWPWFEPFVTIVAADLLLAFALLMVQAAVA